MKQGKYDAAIERFKDATQLQPKLAEPYMLLGNAYEKKGELGDAIVAYKKYLDVYRKAPDREKVQKHIQKLEADLAREQ